MSSRASICASSCGRRHLSVRTAVEGLEAEPFLLRAPARIATALQRAGVAGETCSGWVVGDLGKRSALVDDAVAPRGMVGARG